MAVACIRKVERREEDMDINDGEVSRKLVRHMTLYEVTRFKKDGDGEEASDFVMTGWRNAESVICLQPIATLVRIARHRSPRNHVG